MSRNDFITISGLVMVLASSLLINPLYTVLIVGVIMMIVGVVRSRRE